MTRTRLFRILPLLCSFAWLPLIVAQETGPDVAALIDQLSGSGTEETQLQDRRDAARLLSEIGPQAAPAVPALTVALDDRDTQVWFHAVTALAEIGPGAIDAFPALVDDLRGGGRRSVNAKWYRSAYALGRMGPTVVPQLRSALDDSDSGIRSGIALAIGWLGPEGQELAQDLITLLKDESESVRLHAAESLGKMGSGILPDLEQALASTDHQIQLGTLQALKTLGAESAPLANQVVQLSKASDTPDIQAAALRTLRSLELEPNQVLETTWALAQHTDESVLHEVGNNLLELPSDITLPKLRERLGFKDLASRLWAADILGRMGPAASPAAPELTQQIAASPSSLATERFTKAIASIGPSASGAVFDHLRQVETAKIQPTYWAVKCLGSYGIPGLQQLQPKLRSEHLNERLASIYAISHLGANARSVVSRIERSLQDQQPAIKAASLYCLMAIASDPDRYRDDVKRLLDEQDTTARRIAATSIARLSRIDPPMIQRLGELLQDADPEVRLSSTQALSSIGEDAASETDQIAALLVEDRIEIKVAAVNAIGSIGTASQLATSQIAFLAGQSDGDLRLAAMNGLSRIGSPSPRFAKVVRSALNDPEEAIREAALKAFPQIIEETEESLKVNLEALEDEAVAVRLVAAKNLGDLGEAATPAIRPLMDLLSDRGNFTSYLNALKDIPADADHLDAYRDGLESGSSGVRAFACEALGRLEEIALPAIPRLERLARKDRSGYVRSRARSAVERITGEDREWD